MKRKLGAFLMGIGAMLLAAALSLFLVNQQESLAAGQQSRSAAQQLEAAVMEQVELRQEAPDALPLPDPYDPAMTEVEVDGNYYIGYLLIPELELELPVMSDWSYEQLKVAPCRYYGSTKTDNLVLMAHNYPKHFGNLRKLSAGSELYFTDADGVSTGYVVVAIDVLDPSASEEMVAGEYDLTLFTCTYGGEKRVTVRCDRILENT